MESWLLRTYILDDSFLWHIINMIICVPVYRHKFMQVTLNKYTSHYVSKNKAGQYLIVIHNYIW